MIQCRNEIKIKHKNFWVLVIIACPNHKTTENDSLKLIHPKSKCTRSRLRSLVMGNTCSKSTIKTIKNVHSSYSNVFIIDLKQVFICIGYMFFSYWDQSGRIFIWLPQGLLGNDEVTCSFPRCCYYCIIPFSHKQDFKPCNEDGLQTEIKHISYI